ncbi:MAG: glycosyltransferase family 4 protein [Nitrospirota bacterium]
MQAKSMTIFYPVPESMLNPQARFIQIINTAHALASAGANVKLITGRTHGADEDTLLNHYGLSRHPNLEFVFLPMIRKDNARGTFSIGMVFNAALIVYLISRKQDDSVIFVRHLKTAQHLICLKRLHQIPIVFEAHEIFHLTTEKITKQRRLRKQERDVYTAAAALIAITERLRADLVDMFSLQTAHSITIPAITIPDAVRGDMFESALPYEQRRYIFYAGGLYRWKGVDLLIEAMRYLPDETLVIAGGGQRLDELRELAARIGVADQINFTGQLSHSDVINFMRQAKAAVIPNLPESVSIYSSPLKMFEYMALNCPIAAANIPGIAEILTDGKDAVFFTPGDVQSLAAAIKSLTDNPDLAKGLAAAGQALAKGLTYEKRAERIIDFIGNTFYNA